jgi:hypothetical protein
MVLLRRCLAAGVPVPEAVGAVVLRGAFGWRGFLLTREEEPALDLEAWAYESPARRAGPGTSDVLRAAGAAVRRLHDAGVSHADLHPKNLLLVLGPGTRARSPAASSVLVLDLDRAVAHPGPLPDEERLKNLVRLGRAVEKHRLRGMSLSRRDALRFLEGYAGSRDAGETWLSRVRERLSRGLAARVLWWRLTGQARRRAPAGEVAAPGGRAA